MTMTGTQMMEAATCRVLIVEDDVDLSEALLDYLQPNGFDCVLAHDLSQAQDALRRDEPSVVLLDIRLGSEFGLDLLPWLQKHRSAVRVIVITGYADTDIAIEALRRGAYDFMRKPVEPSALVTRLKRAIEFVQLNAEHTESIRALKNSEANMRIAQQVGRFGSWELNLKTGAGYWSEEHFRLFGVEPGQFVPTREAYLNCVHPEDRPRLIAAFDTLALAEGPIFVEYRIMLPDGAVRRMSSTALAARGADGTPERWYGVVQDTTERTVTEERLRESQKLEAVEQLAGRMAHEVNNMLQIIRGFTELAQQESTEPEIKDDLSRVLAAAKHATDIVRQLLSFSRKDTLQRHVVDINARVSDLARLLPRLISAQIEVQITIDDNVRAVEADAGMLDQVLINICVNAKDAMPAGGVLKISTRSLDVIPEQAQLGGYKHAGRYSQIQITDTGHGMTADVRRRIFEPFFTTKEVGKGSGIGLSVAYGIVQQHGGRIDVSSEPDAGSTFTISLPVTEQVTPGN